MSLKGKNLLVSSANRSYMMREAAGKGIEVECVPDSVPFGLLLGTVDFEEYVADECVSARKREKDMRKQRNLALALCAVFFAMALLFLFRPAPEARTMPAVSSGADQARTEPVEINYVASKNSDKYHLPSCQFAGNILPENRIEIDSKLDLAIAENKGYTPCSVCLP